MTKAPNLVFIAAALLALPACAGKSNAPAPEVVETQVKLDLPQVPAFEEPQGFPDGTYSVQQMRRRGKKFLDQSVTVKGYVVWIYDCAQAIGAQAAKDTPDKCDKPNFYLGDTADSPQDRTIWVVEVPRPPRDDEKRFLPKEELDKWPEVPEIAVGKKYDVNGTWSKQSPRGFVNSDGLLVYAKVAPAE